jgi:hypothetical protein
LGESDCGVGWTAILHDAKLNHVQADGCSNTSREAWMTTDDTFAKIIGRQPSQAERDRLYRVRDAVGLHDNDAFWYIVMILEHYDSLYRDYPKQIGDEARRVVEEARRMFAVAAEAESAKAQKMLAQKVAETSVDIARKLAERPVGVHRITALLGVVVLFGAMCMTVGYQLADGANPLWPSAGATAGGRAVAMVLGAPAGWMVFAMLLPAAGYGARAGFHMATDVDAAGVRKALGWILVGFCVLAAAVGTVVLAKILRY